jgi:serine/threonine protein kinase
VLGGLVPARGGVMSSDFPQPGDGLAVGSWVAGYRLEQRIGQGGMAVVYQAHDERLGRTVALKVLAPALAADVGFRQRFIRESRAAAAVDDPHIIPVFEAGEAGSVLFIAMRYVRGGDVRSLLRRLGTIPAARAAGVVSQVASALDAAHAAGLVHRDVKPANMLLDMRPGQPDHVYLSDFGLSKAALGSAGLTGSGQFLGTVDYAAPEQIEGRAVDGRADQYALGCAAFEMLCGQPPFQREHGMAVLMAHLREPPPPVSPFQPELPGRLDAVFTRVLAKSPEHRFASCREFADALRIALRVAPYDAGSREDAGLPAGRPDTHVVSLLPVAGDAAALSDTATAGPAPVSQGTTQPSGSPAQPGHEQPMPPDGRGTGGAKPAARWPLIVAAAAVVVAVAGLASAVAVLATRPPAASTPPAGVPTTTRTVRATSPAAAPSPAAAIDNAWISQLASVPVSEGTGRLQQKLGKVRLQIPQAQVLQSSQYASLRPGYWVIYYAGSFTNGTHALAYCAAHGRATRNQCIGRYLSHNAADYQYQCYPPASAAAPGCYRS